jgi:hypothetical protein
MSTRDDLHQAVVRVDGGRGFVVETEDEDRFVITAGHRLPHLPPCLSAWMQAK